MIQVPHPHSSHQAQYSPLTSLIWRSIMSMDTTFLTPDTRQLVWRTSRMYNYPLTPSHLPSLPLTSPTPSLPHSLSPPPLPPSLTPSHLPHSLTPSLPHSLSPPPLPPSLRKVTLMEDRESVIHLRNLSLQPANNEEEGGRGQGRDLQCIYTTLCSTELAVSGRHKSRHGRGMLVPLTPASGPLPPPSSPRPQ